MVRINRTTGLLWVMLVFFTLYPPVFAWVNRTAIVLGLLPVFYIAYHYRFIASMIAIGLLIPVNFGLVFLLGGNEQLRLMNWSNFWAAHIAFFCLGFATQYVNALKHKIQLELEERKQLQIQLKQQIQAVQKANDSKDHLLLAISHDLRTPVSAVIEMADLLIHEPDEAKKNAYSETIRQSALVFLDSVNDLLNTHRDSIEPNYLRFDVDQLLNHILQLFRPLYDKKNLILTYHSPGKLPVFYGQVKMLRQVIFNLLDNSLKNTSEGEVVISVRAIATDSVSRLLEISISDTGCGMPEAIQQAILNRTGSFSPHHNSDEGYGLGLNHCLWLLDELHGVLDIQSEPGQGSSFCIEVPLTINSEGAINNMTSTEVEIVQQSRTASGLSVLLLEDEPVYAEAILQKFRLLDIDCQWIKSAGQAEKLMSATAFDLVLLDTQLPDSPDGVIIKKISRDRAGTLFPPTVIISGNVYGKTIIQWMLQGGNLILNKPISMQEIKQLLALYPQDHAFSMTVPTIGINKVFLLDECQTLGFKQVRKLIRLYIESAPSALEGICQYFAMQKYTECAYCLHKFSSALNNLGLNRLAELSRDAEMFSKRQQRIDLSFCLYQLVRGSHLLEQQLNDFLEEYRLLKK